MEKDYNFDSLLSEIYNIYEENENIHNTIIKSKDIEEVRNSYDSIYYDIASIL
jgi:hypothetical protein